MKDDFIIVNMKDTQGRYRTRSLFKELIDNKTGSKYDYVYTLAQAKKIYLDTKDPTEYKAAMKLVGNWEHWMKLIITPLFLLHLIKWREEMEVMLRAEAIEDIRIAAKTQKGFSAAKWLAEKGWDIHKRGRPSNNEIEREKRIQAGIKESLKDDAERILN